MTRPIQAALHWTRRLRWLSAMAALALSGCITAGGGIGLVGPSKPAAPPVDPRLAADPETFALDAIVLWNGQTTQPGAWIALPDTSVARRVRLTNTETGAEADAAMFRRDPTIAGPRIVVSADAARALGLEPGHATPITIVALRYRTAGEIAAAKAAEEAHEAATETSEAPEEPDPDAEATADASAPDASAPDIVPPAPDTETEAEQLAAAVEAALATLFAEEAAPQSATEAAYTPGPDTPVPAPRPHRAPLSADGEAIADGRTFVDAGTFIGADAAAIAERLREAGLTVEIRTLTRGTEQLSRVLVGPFASAADRDAALEAVRQAGAAGAAPSGG